MTKSLAYIAAFCGVVSGACSSTAPKNSVQFPSTPYSNWRTEEPAYKFFPGDQLEVNFATAPELNRQLVVAPDGRISLPLVGSLMVANRSPKEIRMVLQQAYARELVDPTLTVSATGFASQQIFVTGDVRNPGAYNLPGQINTLQAIALAGGWVDTSKPEEVLVMRRGRNGAVMTRVVDVKAALQGPGYDRIGPLQRMDVVFVSRKRIANQNLFVRQFIRDALPINFSIFYNLNGDNNR